jgi:4-amino-4-deoxy-L-arabinose transferase-like glycosyltransferase
LYSGPYSLFRIWLGPFANAGLLALPLLYLTVRHWRHRHELSRTDKSLWILVLSFLLVYSIPSQRQENYLLPIMPALAVLLGGEWKRIGRPWLYVFCLPVVLGLLTLIWLTAATSSVLPTGSYPLWQRVLPWLAIAAIVGGLLLRRNAPYVFHLGALCAFASLAAALAPFDGPAGRYDRSTQMALSGKVVYVPSNFVAKYERHRFILPESEIEGYDPADRQRLNQLLRSGQIVAIERPMGQTVPGSFEVYGRRLSLRSRQRRDEIARILIDRELDLLVQQELIVQRRSP